MLSLPHRRTRGEIVRARLVKAPLSARFGMLMLALYILTALFAPLIAPYGEAEVTGKAFQPWSDAHWLGTDQLGRDMLARMIYAARNSMGIAFLATLLSFMTGGVLGIVSALLGGWADQAISRVVDALMAIPGLIFALMALALLGPTVPNLIFVIAAIDATRVFRLTRAVALGVVAQDFVEAARLRGEGPGWIVLREILPHTLPPLITEFGLRYCFVFLTIAALSFLGVGLQPPTADWGSMVRQNATLITYGNITPLLPAAAIALLTLSVNFVVDWLLQVTGGVSDGR
ncbi:MAG: ABC transporter permease [Rhodobacteraceae bacterium]|nr:ABC transporter permease [Paracoccaceae bacterium]